MISRMMQKACTALLCASFFLCLCAVVNSNTALAAPKTKQSQLQGLIAEYNALLKDAKKAAFRHNWERLDNRFTRLAKNSSGDVKVQASYYSARSKHSLAEKSFNGSDFRAASTAYLQTAALSPKHALAPESLYRAAYILGVHVKDTGKGQELANRVVAEYPKSSQAGKAKNLLTRLSKAPQPTPARSSSKKDRVQQLGLTVKTIMIDPGHGGKDPGTQGNGIRERDFTLSFSKILGAELKKAGYTVVYTRTGNTFLALNKRTEMANVKKADLFISIHVNSNKNSKVNGLETYYLDEANSDSARKVAARENSVSMSQVSDVQFILTDLMLNSKLKESRTLAQCVHSGILRELRNRNIAFRDNKVRPAPFYVLMGARMPSVLIELGYASNASDARNLKNKNFLTHQARGIVKGIGVYKAEVAKGVF